MIPELDFKVHYKKDPESQSLKYGSMVLEFEDGSQYACKGMVDLWDVVSVLAYEKAKLGPDFKPAQTLAEFELKGFAFWVQQWQEIWMKKNYPGWPNSLPKKAAQDPKTKPRQETVTLEDLLGDGEIK